MNRFHRMTVGMSSIAIGVGMLLAWGCFGRRSQDSESGRSFVGSPDGVHAEQAVFATGTSDFATVDDPEMKAALEGFSERLREGDIRAALEHLAALEDAAAVSEALVWAIAGLDGEHAGGIFRFFIDVMMGNEEGELADVLEDFDEGVLVALLEKWLTEESDAFFDYALSGGTRLDEQEWLGPEIAMLGASFLLPHDRDVAAQALQRMRDRWPDEFGDGDGDEYAMLAQGLALRSTAEAIAWLREADPDSEDYDELFDNGIRDPQAAFGEIMKIEDDGIRDGVLEEFFEQWAAMDPEAANEALAHVDDPDLQAEITKAIAVELVKRDPEEGMKLALETDHAPAGLQAWAEVDPDRAVEWALENGDLDMLQGFFMLAEDDLPLVLGVELLEVILDFGGNPSAFLHDNLGGLSLFTRDRGLFPRWLQSDSEAALEWAVSTPAQGTWLGGFGQLAGRSVYRENPDEALRVYSGLPEGRMRAQFQTAMIVEMVADDPQGAETWLGSLHGEEADRAARTLYAELAKSDPEGAFERASNSGHATAVEGVVMEWVQRGDAAHVYEWVADRMADSAPIRKTVFKAWADQDPWAAGNAILENASDALDVELVSLVENWAARDAEGASRFINGSFEPGPLRDSAVAELIDTIHKKDPASAREWAMTIGSPEERERILGVLAEAESGGQE